MIVLGIESSCDETAAAVVRADGVVLSDVVASQFEVHQPFGGVVPELASRAHLSNVIPVIEQAVRVLPRGFADLDAVAVTNGPGLVGALLVGLSAAKAIAWSRGLPIVGVNHLVGHLLAVYLRHTPEAPEVTLPMPYIALLASGGHTALYRVDSPSDIAQLGETRDDAAGEAFDKVAKLLGLGYPGGPIVDRLAAQGDPKAVSLPLPMRNKHGLEFSFSGLKTAVATHVRKHGVPKDERTQADLCASFQRAVVTSLVDKSLTACAREGVPRLVLGGGVAANRGLRALASARCQKAGVDLYVPSLASCTDNAAMIAYAGAQRLVRGERDTLDLSVFSRSPILRSSLRETAQSE
ncbi:MAG: TsaD/Kae1/Qri7 protein required for threonylcarbamoyladenosine t(6)A37 formation in tRNA [Myxococcaceae bacterium]|nr:TsaD/Kae1/Qri7 protein required for threonylcarbamoyladenosine t(6)A37 formation in tRNA [Myxococcaceae bacterium]